MKKIIFTAYNLDVGGIERALINLLKSINYKKYKVTLMLEKKEGIFLNEIPKEVKILEYRISTYTFTPLRKVMNRLKLIKTIVLMHNKYDFSCCYTPYSIPGSILTKYFSKNNSIWIHSDYYYLYNKNNVEAKQFFDKRGIERFKRIVFVANQSQNNFLKLYPNLKEKTIVCNNLINSKMIEERANEKIKEKKPNRPLFINISRHDEHSKRLTRLIKASKKLVDDGYNFEVWLIGSGDDTSIYEKMIKELELENNIKMLGFKCNPYPYYKKTDAYILTSEYEGFPVVFVEALIFDIPIITTINVTDEVIDIEGKYGLIVNSDEMGVYKGMKEFIDKGFKIKDKFDPIKFNEAIIAKIENMLNDKVVK